jgi:hypothetical protein
LQQWFAGERTRQEAESFQKLLLEIRVEKQAVDESNRRFVEEANKRAPKVPRTIVLPGGYRSEEDFNPGAYIPADSLPRDRYVAFNRTFGEASAPLKFDRALTAELLFDEAKPEYERLKAKHEALKKNLPKQYPYLMGVGEFEPYDLQFNPRGTPEDLGEIVPRQFPPALSGGKPIPLREGSGRLQLAEAVASNPLAARVAANRVWLWLFGQGLVRTPSNFGRSGERPVLPELLEHLAGRLEGGHAPIKNLIREIVLSEAYQRTSTSHAANGGRTPPTASGGGKARRLEAERSPTRCCRIGGSIHARRSVGPTLRRVQPAYYARTSPFNRTNAVALRFAAAASQAARGDECPAAKAVFPELDTLARRSAALAKRSPGLTLRRESRAPIDCSSNARRAKGGNARTCISQQGGEDRWQLYAQVLLSSNEFAYVD